MQLTSCLITRGAYKIVDSHPFEKLLEMYIYAMTQTIYIYKINEQLDLRLY